MHAHSINQSAGGKTLSKRHFRKYLRSTKENVPDKKRQQNFGALFFRFLQVSEINVAHVCVNVYFVRVFRGLSGLHSFI